MSTKTLLQASIFPFLLTLVDSLQLCSKEIQKVCYPCESRISNYFTCTEISDQMKIIYFETNQFIDYTKYQNSHVRLIEEPQKITLYPCHRNTSYIQVDLDTYYPIGSKLKLKFTNKSEFKSVRNSRFQSCLETHCLTKNNRFVCHDHFVQHLDFKFNQIVTTQCIQNITIALIFSRYLTKIVPNMFFLNAYNLIYVVFDLDILEILECSTFENLKHLRLVDFQVLRKTTVRNYECVFQYNPNIVFINDNNNITWNTCERNDFKTGPRIQWIRYAIVTLLLLCILTTATLSFIRICLRKSSSSSNAISVADPSIELDVLE